MAFHTPHSLRTFLCLAALTCHLLLAQASVARSFEYGERQSSHLQIRNVTAVRQNGTANALNTATYSNPLMSPLDDLSISAGCQSALTAPLDCAPYMNYTDILYQWSGFPVDALDELCTDACASSVANYRANVLAACVHDVYVQKPINLTEYSGTIPGTGNNFSVYNAGLFSANPIAFADYYVTNYNLVCMQDPVYDPPEYCYALTGNGTNATSYSSCGYCAIEPMYIKLQDSRMNSDYLASVYSSKASSCGSTASPVPKPTAVFQSNPNAVSGNYTTPTCTGRFLPVPTGKTCDQTAMAYGVSTDSLLAANNLAGNYDAWPSNLTSMCIEGSCTVYQVAPNDTCQNVASTYNITLTQLLSWNSLIDPQCHNWNRTVGHYICVSNPFGYIEPNVTIINVPGVTASTAVAVPTNAVDGSNRNCGFWYEVQPGDYCALLSTKLSISLDDFLFLNPEVNSNCSNLFLNYSYCVEPVGYIEDYPGYGGVPTTTISGTTIDVGTLTTVAKVTYTTPVSTDPPLANNSYSGCTKTFNNFYGSLRCQDVAGWIGIPLADFVRWNPSLLDADGNYTILSCKLQNNTQYCGSFYDPSLVATTTGTAYLPVPTDATANSTDQCVEYYNTVAGDTCTHIEEEFQIPLWAFYEWNPAIGPDCTNLWLSASYCVAGPGWDALVPNDDGSWGSDPSVTTSTSLPGPTQTGIVSNCDTFYLAKSGDTCSGISGTYHITVAQFYVWNPAVGDGCLNLWAGYEYCVGVPANGLSIGSTIGTTSRPTATTAAPTTTSSVTPPGPTQSGIVANCNKYAITQSGDGCYVFAARYNITLDQLYQWNAVLNNNCENFWASEAYCIGVSS